MDPTSPKNYQRIFAIGDVHGCAIELEALLRKMDPQKEDLVVFLGDYIDRGANSRRVVDIVLDLGTRCDVVALKGNHEAMFLDFLEHPESVGAGLFILNGGFSTLANYTAENGAIEMPETHVHFFRSLKLCFETDQYFFVHAGIPDIPLRDLSLVKHEQNMLWSRFPFLSSDYNWGKLIVHGHTPVHNVESKPNRLNLDTGCVYDGLLTAMELNSREIFQVEKGIKNEPALYPKEFESSRMAARYSGRLAVQAGRDGQAPRNYETYNFNQFGLLMRDLDDDPDFGLAIGDQLTGRIGDEKDSVEFLGTVMRSDMRRDVTVYGVRIDKMSRDSGRLEWFEQKDEPKLAKAKG